MCTYQHPTSQAVALRRAEAAALAEPEPASAPRLVPSHRSKTRGIGVFDPHLDLREAGDPERLERHHALPEESSGIYFRSSRPLPQEKMGLAQDEDFVSTFRRPLKAEASSKDPLGAAAPQIDVAALKAMSEETVSSELPELGEIVFPSLPGAGAPPALRSRASPSGTRPAQRVRQLPLGTAKQARLKDDLSDLLKPGDSHRSTGGRGGVAGRNSAMAAQRMLYKSLKQGNQKHDQGLHPNYELKAWSRAWVDLILTLRLMRLMMLESWTPALQSLGDVACYALVAVWYMFTVCLYVIEKDSNNDVSERFANVLERHEAKEERLRVMAMAVCVLQRRFRARRRRLEAAQPEPPQQVSMAKAARRLLRRQTSLGRVFMALAQAALVINICNTMLESIPEIEAMGVEARSSLTLRGERVFGVCPRSRPEMRIYFQTKSLKDQLDSPGMEAFIECVAACRVVRVLDWPQIRREVLAVKQTLKAALPSLAMPAVISLQLWVLTAGIFANDEFTDGAGSRMCIFYCLCGVALFSIPVGIMVEAGRATLEKVADERKELAELKSAASKRPKVVA
eukprot:g17671.t1